MGTARDALDTAVSKLTEARDGAAAAARAVDGVSDPLTDRVYDVVVRADEARTSAIRARDALDHAGA